MTAHRRAARAEDINGTSALDPSDATITWLSSVGYESPGLSEATPGARTRRELSQQQRYETAPEPFRTPPAGLSVHQAPEPNLRAEDPWVPVARRRRAMARNWFAVLGVAAICALLTLAGSSFVAPTYAASSVVRVTTGIGALASRDSVTASNDLAAQFSQLIETAEVKDAAAKQAGVSDAEVQGHVTATVLSNQNLIQVTAKAGSGEKASAISAAAATVLTRMAEASLEDTVTPVVQAQMAQLDTAIQGAQKDLNKLQRKAASAEPGSSSQVASQAEINGSIGKIAQLQYRKLQLQQDNVIGNAQRQVLLNDLGPAGPAAKQSPRPVLYAIIAFALAVVIGAQVAVTWSGRRNAG